MCDYDDDTSFVATGPDGEMHWYPDEAAYLNHWESNVN